MILRHAYAYLKQWRDQPGRKPLLLRGARQVGKTFLIREFGQSFFPEVVEINCELQPQVSEVFGKSIDPKVILPQLALLMGKPIEAGQTLLFLDEVQACPQAITALRYFFEIVPELHVVAAGSLLEFALEAEGFSMPVGRVQPLHMHPLTFSEFLSASGEDLFLNFIANEVSLETTVPKAVHDKGLALTRQYSVVGGMPEAVAAYLPKPEGLQFRRVQSALLQTSRDDFAKYARTAKHKYLEKVFLSAPGMISKPYVYARVDPETPSRELKEALRLLEKAGVLTRIRASSGAGLPLEVNAADRKFKLAFLDIGLVQAALKLQAAVALSSDFLAINSGALAEQFVAQELIAAGDPYERTELFYWERAARGSSAEVDFIYPFDNLVLPIEVKSGSTGRLLSMRAFMKKYHAPLGIRVSQHPLSLHDGVLSVPFYLMPSLKRLVEAALK